MKAAKITILLIITIVLINWLRIGNFDEHLLHCLPLLGGKKPSLLYDTGGIVCLLIGLWGLSRLKRNKNESDE
jgi:hypothetical protein